MLSYFLILRAYLDLFIWSEHLFHSFVAGAGVRSVIKIKHFGKYLQVYLYAVLAGATEQILNTSNAWQKSFKRLDPVP